MIAHAQSRRATALVVVLGLVATLVVLATTFFSLASERRGLADVEFRRQRTALFADEVRDRLITMLIEERLDPTGYASHQSDWYTAHAPRRADGSQTWVFDYRGMSLDPEHNVRSYEELWADWEGGRTSTDSRFRFEYYWPIDQYENGDTYSGNYASHSRWTELHYLDETLHAVPSTVADQRAAARYTLRYAAMVFDNAGMLRASPGWPDEPATVDPSNGNDYLRWLQFKNYTERYARNAKSMMGGFDGTTHGSQKSYTAQYIPSNQLDYPWWPFDREVVCYRPDGIFATGEARLGQHMDQRLTVDSLMRRSGIMPMKNDGNAYTLLPRGAFNAKQVDIAQGNANEMRMWFGFARGLRDADLGGTDPVTTPWRINMLTGSPSALGGVVLGLSDRFKVMANAPVLGRGYPEPFPLEKDSGRLVSLLGSTGTGYSTLVGKIFCDYRRESYPSDRLDYWGDMVFALAAAIRAAREQHNQLWEPQAAGSEISSINVTPEEIQESIHREFLRILGEPNIRPSGGRLISDGGLLSLGYGTVGYGGKFHGPGRDDPDRLDSQNWERRTALLPANADTRAMEYALNDFCMSLFGAANPAWRPGQELAAAMVDFNGDGMVESSATGWWDGKQTVWSFWWDGLGPDEHLDTDPLNRLPTVANGNTIPEWMQVPGWYRMYYDGASMTANHYRICRWNGRQWEDIYDTYGNGAHTMWMALNKLWLNPGVNWPPGAGNLPGDLSAYLPPIKPFSHTGRLYVGKSDTFTVFLRADLYDLEARESRFQINRELRVHLDPHGDGDPSDWYISYAKDSTIPTGERY